MKYGKAIKVARVAKGFSQKKLGEKCNLDSSYISRIEAGDRIPNIETLELIAKELEIPFYLLVLMASDENELKGVSNEIAALIGQNLLKAVIKIEESDEK